jgi:general secretion pathway protein N
MMPRFAITALLGALLVATLGVLAWETDFGRALMGREIEPPLRKASLDTNVLPAYQLGAMDSVYRETVERPLFVPTRKPAPPSNATPVAVMKKGQFRLAGTTVNSTTSYVYLFETATNKTHRLAQGSQVNGIVVNSIEATRVVLKQGDDTEELRLVTLNSPRVAAVAGQPNMPGQPGMPMPPGNIGVTGAPQFPGAANLANNMPQPVTAGNMPIPSASAQPVIQQQFPPGVASGGVPLQPGDPSNPQAVPPNQPDPNSPAVRRRRFQNLPQ